MFGLKTDNVRKAMDAALHEIGADSNPLFVAEFKLEIMEQLFDSQRTYIIMGNGGETFAAIQWYSDIEEYAKANKAMRIIEITQESKYCYHVEDVSWLLL